MDLAAKARFWAVAGIGLLIVMVDFTSWLMSAATEVVMVGAILAILWSARK